MTADRKKEAHQKFLLGGIVIRAGLSNVDRAFLLGGLLELARLSPETSEYRRLQVMGEIAFRVPVSIGAYRPVVDASE
ncbi:conjugal transfer protein TraD [Brucella pituitosa]|uniref:conjugal transfer protein TraD n=1 Tax=Brucella pituitosa TaxID=571256 RepID=UPI000CFE8517|nr:conjugal transfer protein TraD [Ochrobactrum sp. MYb68]